MTGHLATYSEACLALLGTVLRVQSAKQKYSAHSASNLRPAKGQWTTNDSAQRRGRGDREVPRRGAREQPARVFQVYLGASCTPSAARGAHTPPNKWRAAHPLYREGHGDSERSPIPRIRKQGLARPRESPLHLKLSFPMWATGHLTLRGTKSRWGANQKRVSAGRTFSGARGPPARHTHLISDHTGDTIAGRLRAQGQSARPPLPVAKRQGPLGTVVSLVSRKDLRELESCYRSEMPEIWVPPQKRAGGNLMGRAAAKLSGKCIRHCLVKRRTARLAAKAPGKCSLVSVV